ALAEGLEAAQPYRIGRVARIYVTNPGHLPRLLRLGGERRGEEQNSREAGDRRPHPEEPEETVHLVQRTPKRATCLVIVSWSAQRRGEQRGASECEPEVCWTATLGRDQDGLG